MKVPGVIGRILLVGFMGSGKTLVGQALARRLGWVFRDFDQEVRSRVGLPIPEIFRQHGEGWFREMEGRVGRELMQEQGIVLASGGGWPVVPGRMDEIGSSTLTVWLRVSPAEAVRRAQQEGITRPLMAVEDPVGKACALLERRIAYYEKARLSIDSSQMEPEELAKEIEGYVNDQGLI